MKPRFNCQASYASAFFYLSVFVSCWIFRRHPFL